MRRISGCVRQLIHSTTGVEQMVASSKVSTKAMVASSCRTQTLPPIASVAIARRLHRLRGLSPLPNEGEPHSNEGEPYGMANVGQMRLGFYLEENISAFEEHDGPYSARVAFDEGCSRCDDQPVTWAGLDGARAWWW